MAELVFHYKVPLSFPRILAYIGRYETSQRAAVADGVVYQVLADRAGHFLTLLRAVDSHTVAATQLTGRHSKTRDELITRFVARSFGSDRDHAAFYRFAKADPVLHNIVRRFRGVRMVGVVNLWECLLWSVMGQQVSVASAFAMRSRLARHSGAVVRWNEIEFEGFPTAARLLAMTETELRGCGFSIRKAEYVRSIAAEICSGSLDEAGLLVQESDVVRARLLALRGIGPWSVEYAMMRVFAEPDACPLEDVGLRNAIGREYGLGRQATTAETIAITDGWKPFRAFGTFFLWQTLW